MGDLKNQTQNLQARYMELVEAKEITEDGAQKKLVSRLCQLQQELTLYDLTKGNSSLHNFFKKKPQKKEKPQGVYIHGDVGAGKSMLMDMFFATTSIAKKRRIHFHAFMMEIHNAMHEWRSKNKNNADAKDPIPPLAEKISNEAWLLCFDEFQVHDIADAMILGRLFTCLFENGVIVVATSNRPPADLYKDGLQREHFLPFIDLLKKQMDVVSLDADKDYRLDRLKSMETVFFNPLGDEADEYINDSFAKLTNHAKPGTATLLVGGRKLYANHVAGDVAIFSFAELCEQPLGAADYQEIATEFNTVLIRNIPILTPEHRNEAKRFVTLIDQFYEHKVKIICSAAAPPESLYPEGDGAFEFQRTVSRLMEMQSEEYFHSQHIG